MKTLLFLFLFLFSSTSFARTSLSKGLLIEGKTTQYPKTLKNQKDSRIFWWNIAGEGFKNLPLPKVGLQNDVYWSDRGAVLGNILRHITKYQPDLIILGEFPEGLIANYEMELPSYSFVESIPYYPGSSNTIAIFSRQRIVEISEGTLDIAAQEPSSPSNKNLQINKSFWNRNYISDRTFKLFQVQTETSQYILSPLHLVNPWPTYSKIYRNGNYPGAGAMSYLKVAKNQMLRGEVTKSKKNEEIYNPLQNQVRDYLDQTTQSHINQEPLLLIGDFNSPTRILPYGYPRILGPSFLVPGLGHRLFEKHYQSSFKLGFDNIHTIPTETAGKGKPKVRIDKAFTTTSLKAQNKWIFKYAGSDHYPIQLDVLIK